MGERRMVGARVEGFSNGRRGRWDRHGSSCVLEAL